MVVEPALSISRRCAASVTVRPRSAKRFCARSMNTSVNHGMDGSVHDGEIMRTSSPACSFAGIMRRGLYLDVREVGAGRRHIKKARSTEATGFVFLRLLILQNCVEKLLERAIWLCTRDHVLIAVL